MSGSRSTDGDDTDALLVIPPDLFLLEESEDSSNSRFRRPLPQQCVKHLAQKVDSLQTRLLHMQENVSNSESFERSPFRRPVSEILFSPIRTSSQKYYTTSSNRKPKQNNRYKRSRRRLELPPVNIQFHSDLSSDSDIGSISSSVMNSPDINSDVSILGEIDTFLETVRNDNYRPDPVENVSNKSTRLPLTNVDNILSKYIYLTNGPSENVNCSKRLQFDADVPKSKEAKDSLCNDNKSSETIRSSTVNSQMPIVDFSQYKPTFYNKTDDSSTIVQNKMNTDFVVSTNDLISNREDCRKDSFPFSLEASAVKSLNSNNVSKVSYDNSETTSNNQKDKFCEQISNVTNSHPDKSLPSLCKLWNDSELSCNQNTTDKMNIEKFEEEKMRRQHCEEIIQTLQKKLLEQQQKLAVAVQIDSAKDEAILKLKNALVVESHEWKNTEQKLVDEIANLQSQSKNLSCDNNKLKIKIKENEEEIVRYERTIHEIEEKLKTVFDNVEHEKNDLHKKIDEQLCVVSEKEKCILELKESTEMLNRLNKQLSENMTNAQENLDKMKNKENEYNERLKEIETTCLSFEDELLTLKKEKQDLMFKISLDDTKNSELKNENINLKTDLKASSEKYNELQHIFNDYKMLTETQKSEMKIYYQKQLDSIVTEKVNEFQKQLDLARNLMTHEIQAKEKEIAFQFAKHLHKVENGHQLEVNILEEKHKEEIKFYSANLSQSKKAIQSLHDKLALYKSKRGEIASQLHTVMESQWQQALKIILNSTADLSNVPMNSAKNKDLHEPVVIQHSHKPIDDELLKEKETESNNCIVDKKNEISKAKSKNEDKFSDDHLLHYVKLLLQRTPGVTDLSGPSDLLCQSKVDTKSKNYNGMSKNVADIEFPTSDKSNEDKKLHRIKPPWK